MKKTFLLIAAAAVFAACTTKDMAVPGAGFDADVLYASIEGSDTKTFVNDNLEVRWNADDVISVFNKSNVNVQYKFNGEDGAAGGTFTGYPPLRPSDVVDYNYVYAVYPWGLRVASSQEGSLDVSFPTTQTYKTGTFAPGNNPMVAASEDEHLFFRNAGGYLRVRLYGENVKVSSIEIYGNGGELISGRAVASITPGSEPVVKMDADASDYIDLVCSDPVTIGSTPETATDFWFVIPPVEFEKGISIYVEDPDGQFFGYKSSKPLTIKRNTRTTTAPLEVVLREPDIIDLYLSGTYTFNTTSVYSSYGYGPYSEDITIVKYDSEIGNLGFVGTLGEAQVVFFGNFDAETGYITIPYGQTIGRVLDYDWDENGKPKTDSNGEYLTVETDLKLYISNGNTSYYSNDLVFGLTDEHKIEFAYPNYYLGLLEFYGGSPYNWFDQLKITSIEYKESKSSSAAVKANSVAAPRQRMGVRKPFASSPVPMK